MNNNKYYIQYKELILNIMYFECRKYLSIVRLQKYIEYIYEKLSENNLLEKYDIWSGTEEDIQVRILRYNNIFKLDIDGDIIYLKEEIDFIKLIKQNPLDEYIEYIIKTYDIEGKKSKEKNLIENVFKSINEYKDSIQELYILNPKKAEELSKRFIKEIEQSDLSKKTNKVLTLKNKKLYILYKICDF